MSREGYEMLFRGVVRVSRRAKKWACMLTCGHSCRVDGDRPEPGSTAIRCDACERQNNRSAT